MQISAIPQSYTAQSTTSAAAKTAISTSSNADSTQKTNNVDISMQGKALSAFPELLLPTRENVQKLASTLLKDLNKLFTDAGIDINPPVQFDIDSYTGKVSVKGDRPDAQKIADLLKSNMDVELEIHNLAAISSHVDPLAKAMEASNAVGAAKNEQEAAKVVAKYADVYGGKSRVVDFSILFSGSDIQINADGKAWMNTSAT